MNSTEQRLSELLHQLTPEPPNAISADSVAGRVREPVVPHRLGWRGWVPAAAAAAVVAIAVISTGLIVASRGDHESPSTVGQQPGPTPSAVTPSGAPTHTSPSAQPQSLTCRTEALKLDRAKAEGTAGSTYVTYYLTNIGPSSCAMYGFPGVAFLDASGNVVQRPAARDGHANPRFTLLPGHRAQFVVRTGDPSIPGTGCSPSWVSTQVQVYPPDQTAALRIPDNDHVCNVTVSATKPAP